MVSVNIWNFFNLRGIIFFLMIGNKFYDLFCMLYVIVCNCVVFVFVMNMISMLYIWFVYKIKGCILLLVGLFVYIYIL